MVIFQGLEVLEIAGRIRTQALLVLFKLGSVSGFIIADFLHLINSSLTMESILLGFPLAIGHVAGHLKALTRHSVTGIAFTHAVHVLKVGAGAAPAPRVKRRSGEPHLVVRHLENLAVHIRTQAACVLVKGGHDFVALHIQGLVAVLLPGAGEIGAFRHHQAASL